MSWLRNPWGKPRFLALITVLSEKTLPIPELNSAVDAQRGFNVIATANNRDRGVNELSSALMRRFNTVVLPVPDQIRERAVRCLAGNPVDLDDLRSRSGLRLRDLRERALTGKDRRQGQD